MTWESKFWAIKFLFLGKFVIYSYSFEGHQGVRPSQKSFSFISFTDFAERRVKVDVYWCHCQYNGNIHILFISSRFIIIYSKMHDMYEVYTDLKIMVYKT